MRVNLEGIGRGQTIVDQRTAAHTTTEPDLWSRIAVVVDLDVMQAASAFVSDRGLRPRDCARPEASRPERALRPCRGPGRRQRPASGHALAAPQPD